MLVAAGVVSLALAARLTAAALGCDWSPFSLVAPLERGVVGVLVSAVVLVAVALLLWLAARPGGEERLRLAADGATIVVAREALAAALAREAEAAHPDVVRVRLALGVRGAVLRGRATVLARPLADAEAVRAAPGRPRCAGAPPARARPAAPPAMTSLQRSLATAVGLVLLVLVAALVAREALLAGDAGLAWSPPHWWVDLTARPAAAAVGALVAAGLALALWLAAARLLRGESAPAAVVVAAAPGAPVGGEAVVTATALARGLRRRLQAAAPGLVVHRVAVEARRGGAWRVEVEADVAAAGLADAATAAAAVVRAGLADMVGLDVPEVEVVVRTLRPGKG